MSWEPREGRSRSIKRAIRNEEFLVAEVDSQVVGFIHFIIHEDVIDGAPNAFITALYTRERFRGGGIGTMLLHRAVTESTASGATFIETSTLHSSAKAFYERHHFKQIFGEIGEVFLELDVKEFLRAP
jgi:GNAT superfamily N-acetyltransferase